MGLASTTQMQYKTAWGLRQRRKCNTKLHETCVNGANAIQNCMGLASATQMQYKTVWGACVSDANAIQNCMGLASATQMQYKTV